MNTSIVYNIANKLLDKNIRVLFDNHHSLFDYSMHLLDIDLISTDIKFSPSLSYDTYVSNNFFPHATSRDLFRYKHQIIDLMIFHEPCPSKFKKEDKIILANNTRSAFKIFTTDYFASDWGVSGDKSTIIRYGIPQIDKVVDFKDRKPILLLNLKNNAQIRMLYDNIKTVFPDVEILNRPINNNFSETLQALQNYKIVIDIDSSYNILCAIKSGCLTITNQVFDTNIKSSIILQDFREIKNLLVNMLNIENFSILYTDQEYIEIQYPMAIFISKMNNLLSQSKMEPFII